MTDKEEHPIRNGIIIAVVSALILALIPAIRTLIASIFQSIGILFVTFWGHVISKSDIPWGVIWLLIILAIPTVYRVLKPLSKQKPWKPSLKDYREDCLHNVDWKWTGFWGKIPENLSGFCPICQTRLVHQYDRYEGKTSLHCETCKDKLVTLDGDLDHALNIVKRQIERRINTGEWERIVRQRYSD